MSYDIEKLIDILTIFSNHHQDLTKMRISKLLYYLDKYHLQKYGHIVLDDRYYRLPYGPIPSLTLNLLNEVLNSEYEYAIFDDKVKKVNLSEYLEPIGRYRFKMIKEGNFESLSQSELEIINKVLENYGDLSTNDLVEATHKDASWLKTEETNEIDYCLFLEGMPEEEKKFAEGLLAIDKENQILSSILEYDCYF